GVLKQASAEIRAINKQLGINDEPIYGHAATNAAVERIPSPRTGQPVAATRHEGYSDALMER
ncbi:MAG: hypothetical protein RR753_00940, partial [Raoultibacter sp.]